GDGERIEYTVRSRSGRILVRGDTFQAVDGLHWRITVLNHSRRPIDDFSLSGESWRLVPLAGQAYKKRQVTRTVGQDLTNWIIFP
ncbi:MAG: hypothetical protein GWM98_06085, partial [Nitrospinaceae bacterium]|nr:hypothetical protein [Nitrospinaceae bacterium]NIR54108.1 hypothetical protein [Nitrospinaceae bacterium]NIS84527.1 hypothetical protein [Nitrospinaceae bacterium]NIT81339.1 hypothetical protein [Nitrospinaceae bacterium]NIU43608.1 hypothetical protein [Nitrospinaceae bacterium]